jgi:serralysin
MPLSRKVAPVTPDQNTFQDIDGLLSGVAWNLTTITYSYPNSSSDYARRYGNGEPSTGFQALNANQRLAVDYAIDQFDSVTAVSFQRTAFGSSNDKSAIIRYAESNKPSTAWAVRVPGRRRRVVQQREAFVRHPGDGELRVADLRA